MKPEFTNLINHILNKEDDQASALFSQLCSEKLSQIIKVEEAAIAALNTRLQECLLREYEDHIQITKDITLDGAKILVRGKLVGFVKTDIDKIDMSNEDDFNNQDGVSFVSADKSFSKEFIDTKALFDYIIREFLGPDYLKRA